MIVAKILMGLVLALGVTYLLRFRQIGLFIHNLQRRYGVATLPAKFYQTSVLLGGIFLTVVAIYYLIWGLN